LTHFRTLDLAPAFTFCVFPPSVGSLVPWFSGVCLGLWYLDLDGFSSGRNACVSSRIHTKYCGCHSHPNFRACQCLSLTRLPYFTTCYGVSEGSAIFDLEETLPSFPSMQPHHFLMLFALIIPSDSMMAVNIHLLNAFSKAWRITLLQRDHSSSSPHRHPRHSSRPANDPDGCIFLISTTQWSVLVGLIPWKFSLSSASFVANHYYVGRPLCIIIIHHAKS
jgi:hypothetical protein